MRVFSLIELYSMTRRELFQLHAETMRTLSALPRGNTARATLQELLRDIRRVLMLHRRS